MSSIPTTPYACPGSRIIASVLLLCLSFAARSSAGNTVEFNMHEIADNVYVHQGKHVGFDDTARDDIANIGFISGDKCTAVIDTGGSLRIGQALLAQIRKRSALPICYVINTHVHYDHVLGNAAFSDTGAVFVGHRELRDEINTNRSFFLENYADELGSRSNEELVVGPDKLVEDMLELDLGNRVLELRAYATAHSHSDISIYDRKTATLWLSDLLFMERIPALDGSLRGWIAVTRSFRSSGALRIVPGHGPVSADPESAFDAQLHYLEMLLKQTREKIAAGMFMEDIVEEVGQDAGAEWLLFEQHHRRNVTKAFSELEWE